MVLDSLISFVSYYMIRKRNGLGWTYLDTINNVIILETLWNEQDSHAVPKLVICVFKIWFYTCCFRFFSMKYGRTNWWKQISDIFVSLTPSENHKAMISRKTNLWNLILSDYFAPTHKCNSKLCSSSPNSSVCRKFEQASVK